MNNSFLVALPFARLMRENTSLLKAFFHRLTLDPGLAYNLLWCFLKYFILLFFKDFIYLFSEGKGGKEGGKHQCVVASHAPPTGDLARNPGMCPDWKSNW